MKTWNQLFVRHGWLLEEVSENQFDCENETKENLEFLQQSLKKANVDFTFDVFGLTLHQAPIHEEDWIKVLQFEFRGKDGSYWYRPSIDTPVIQKFDTYIIGVVRQLNRLGFYTTMSCDGHDERPPKLYFDKGTNMELLINLLQSIGIQVMPYKNDSYHIRLRVKREELLELAEKLSLIQLNWLDKDMEFIKQQIFNHEIETCLSIQGVSGEESNIREMIKEKLTPYVDYIAVDHYGNLLAEKIYGHGHGPTILLNAHLDTVDSFVEHRMIMKDDNIWTSSEGILGADDRAGVAILLAFAKNSNLLKFQGKVKFIFTVEEEIGLVGAKEVNEYFLWGVDAAIVLDRRGKGDIVTSCAGTIPFCDEQYGKFFEQVAEEIGLTGWACTPGGSSDTRIWASHGIQSVNLSVGYGYEHTDSEFLDVQATYETFTLLKAVFERSRDLHQVVRKLKLAK